MKKQNIRLMGIEDGEDSQFKGTEKEKSSLFDPLLGADD